MKPKSIRNQSELANAARKLAREDPVLGGIYERLGPPPLWARKPGLPTLVKIVLEQQVSLASGRAAFAKLNQACNGRVTASRIAALGETGLRIEARLTRQKAAYVTAIAEAVTSKKLKIKPLETLPDDHVREQLMAIKGIGNWTADIYLLMALCRADVLPLGDIALENEIAKLCRLRQRPTNEWFSGRAERWRPWRAAAARMIWHSYLDRQGRHDEL